MGKIDSLVGCIKYVEIEVNSRCNRKCSYCPVSLSHNKLEMLPEFMRADVFKRIISQLLRINYAGVISYHFYNEPLIRKDLEELVAYVRLTLPKAFQVLYTNGDGLDRRKYEELLKAGIRHLVVTRHSGQPIEERAAQTVLMHDDLIITNRGGLMSKLKKPLDQPCFSPDERLIVTVTGDVLLCCNDAGRTQVMGNIYTNDLEQIWYSETFVRARRLLKKGNREEASPICKYCDDTEYFAPGEDHHKDCFQLIK